MREVCLISPNGSYILVKETFKTRDDIEKTEYVVKSEGNASKHVVEIRFGFSENIFEHDYTNISIAHGMRMNADSLADTKEYIEVLQEAVDFVPRIIDYVENNPLN